MKTQRLRNTKDCQKPIQRQKETRKDSPIGFKTRLHSPTNTLISDFWSQRVGHDRTSEQQQQQQQQQQVATSTALLPSGFLRRGMNRARASQAASVQFSSVAQSCLTLCNPMNRSTPGLPVHHHLPEFTQTHVHQVSDAIQPSHPRSSPSLPAPNLSQHQGLFQ